MRYWNRIECVTAEAGVIKEILKMSTNQCDIGLIGLAVMGENLVLNMESKGFSVAVFNRTAEVTDKFAAGKAKGKNIHADAHDGGICRRAEASAQGDDHGQSRRAG